VAAVAYLASYVVEYAPTQQQHLSNTITAVASQPEMLWLVVHLPERHLKYEMICQIEIHNSVTFDCFRSFLRTLSYSLAFDNNSTC